MNEKRAVNSLHAGEVVQEHLGDGQDHDRRRGKARRLRFQRDAGEQKRHAEGEPDRRIGIVLRIRS